MKNTAFRTLVLLCFSIGLLKAKAGTIPPDHILDRCTADLDSFSLPRRPLPGNPVEARREATKRYLTIIGHLAPIAPAVTEGPATSKIEIPTKSHRGLLTITSEIDWNSRMGTKTAVVFPDENGQTVEQVVTGSQYFDEAEIEGTLNIISMSLDTVNSHNHPELQFRQSGDFIIHVPGAPIITDAFRAEDKGRLTSTAIIENLKSTLQRIKMRPYPRNLEVTFLQSKEGEGNPLNGNDTELLKTFKTAFPDLKFKIIGLPAIDHGYVAFQIESQ
jgi:hypothetical protein